ncbi:Uncharacterised protein [Halioglobus japonicus]|nr:Uncharacterised protein [Halioglobus japonicus]
MKTETHQQKAGTDPSVTLMRLPQVQQHVPLCRAKIYQMMEAGEFPRPVNLGTRSVAWVATEVLEWVETRIALRSKWNIQ